MTVRRSRRKTAVKTTEQARVSPGMIGAGLVALAAVPVAHAATFNVTNLNDNGAGSLRQAIEDANAAAGPDVITFQSGLTGTITLTTGQLSLYDSVDIQGPGAAIVTVSGNNASRVFYLYNAQLEIAVSISGLTITGGNDTLGGGVVNYNEDLTLDGVTITQNTSSGEGGGLWADGFNMDLTIRNSTISGNTATACGGGIYVEDTGGPMLIENTVISGNLTPCNGGGIFFYDPDDAVTIRDSTISGNHADGIGGGIYVYDTDGGPFTIEHSTISGNDAFAAGGLAFYGPDDPIVIENSTISGNQATGSGGGASFYSLYGGGTLTLNFVTVANNTAASGGGGLALGNGTATVNNSIIADNIAPFSSDVGTPYEGAFDLTYSLLETNDAAVNDINGNLIGVDPQLGVLANNGGPTQTQRPALTSQVVNAADPAFTPPPTTDQRGQPRAYPTRADMGALELVGGVIQFNPTTASVAESTPGSVTLTATRDVGPDPASVDFTTNPGSAVPGAGNDYTTTSGTLNFVAGDLSETFTVPILDDNASEGNEQFTATLSNPSADATIGAQGSATVTIVDDPTGTAQFSTSALSAAEDGGPITVTVTRTGGTEGSLVVNYATADGTAVAPGDYTAASGTITFPAGSATSQTFNVTPINDSNPEGDEMFNVNLTGASVGAPSSIAITIPANDVVPIPAVSLLGKILMVMLSAVAGLYALVRNRFSAVLFALLFIGIAAGPHLSAQTPAATAKHEKETKGSRIRGTLVSITNDGTTMMLTLSGGISVSLPTKSVRIVNATKGKHTEGSLQQVVQGAHLVIKTDTDANGQVKSAKIKITP